MSPIKSQLLNSSNKYLVNYFLGTIYVFKHIGILTYQLDQQGVVTTANRKYPDGAITVREIEKTVREIKFQFP
jgi:hypothetical protein